MVTSVNLSFELRGYDFPTGFTTQPSSIGKYLVRRTFQTPYHPLSLIVSGRIRQVQLGTTLREQGWENALEDGLAFSPFSFAYPDATSRILETSFLTTRQGGVSLIQRRSTIVILPFPSVLPSTYFATEETVGRCVAPCGFGLLNDVHGGRT